jgi:hypothetical protein
MKEKILHFCIIQSKTAINSEPCRPPIPGECRHFLKEIGNSGRHQSESEITKRKSKQNWLIFEKCGNLIFREKEENNITGKVNRAKNQRNTSSEMGVPNQRAIHNPQLPDITQYRQRISQTS